jgi:hypothetical protein
MICPRPDQLGTSPQVRVNSIKDSQVYVRAGAYCINYNALSCSFSVTLATSGGNKLIRDDIICHGLLVF